MDGPRDTASSLSILPTPRMSLQNIGEKQKDDEEGRKNHDFKAFGADGFTFLDFVDIVNPLQHIPLVGTLYREITGDQIDPGSRIAGGTLFGGPVGAAVSLVNVAIEQSSGQDMGEHMMAWFSDDDADSGAVKLANEPAVTDFVTAAGADTEQFALGVSPITANAEVLDWARRETSRAASDGDQALQQAAPVGSTNIATNIEVLNWARGEASQAHPAVQTAARAENPKSQDRQVTEQRLHTDIQQSAVDTNHALGRDQAHLSGASAPSGGWFSENMMLALARYGEGAQLGKSDTARRVEESVNTSE